MKKHLRVLTATAGAALASLALIAPAAQAVPPAAPYEDFAGCPSPAENEIIATCNKFVFDGGHLQLGERNIPITAPITMRGGLEQITGNFVHNDEGGIIPAQQTLEGGLIGLTGIGWLDEVLNGNEKLKVYATVELAGEIGSLQELPISLPIKVHLENGVLGSNCYIGSDESPIQLKLTTETTSPPPPNVPISGQPTNPPEFEEDRPDVRTAKDGIFVDNAFAVPGASGCQLNLGALHIPINGLVNDAVGLPAAAGTNEAVLNYDSSRVNAGVVFP